jgi:hypothetical protein
MIYFDPSIDGSRFPIALEELSVASYTPQPHQAEDDYKSW